MYVLILARLPTMASNKYSTRRIWGSHSGGYEESYLLGYNADQSFKS
jgi:hypothetical protein